MYVVPEAGVDVALGFFTGADVHANTMVRIENLDVKREGGEIEGAYSFPFFPIFLADSLSRVSTSLRLRVTRRCGLCGKYKGLAGMWRSSGRTDRDSLSRVRFLRLLRL